MEHRPTSSAEVTELLRDLAARGRSVMVEGLGSKRDWGRPIEGAERLSMAALSGICSYDPEELILTALAGTPMQEIQKALAERSQHLAFEPPDLGPVWGKPAGGGTIGGVLACNLSGPRRLSAGAARDHFLGACAVNGMGQEFKSGGKVVKNVTGYDLPKLLAGSFGTLAVLTEVTVKTLPAPVKQRTALFGFSSLAQAHAFMIAVQQGDSELDGVALLPVEAWPDLGTDRGFDLGAFIVACRMSGTEASITARCAALRKSASQPNEELHTRNSAAFWSSLRDLRPLLPMAGDLWRFSVPPSDSGAVIGRVLSLDASATWYLDWGGGLAWVALMAKSAKESEAVRAAIAPGRGHATLMKGSEELRLAIDPFPVQEGTVELARRVKNAFDPKGILNPRRQHRFW